MSDLGVYDIYPRDPVTSTSSRMGREPQNSLYGEKRWSLAPDEKLDDMDDMPSLTLNEGIYLFVLSLAGVSLGYVAASLTWPGNLAPLVILAVLLYLIITHRTPLSPSPLYQIRLPPSPTLFADDEESLLTFKADDKGDERLRTILAQERKGALAGVYAFGKGVHKGEEVWVVVEDMDG